MPTETNVTRFPFSRLPGSNRNQPAKELGHTSLLSALSNKPSHADLHHDKESFSALNRKKLRENKALQGVSGFLIWNQEVRNL